MKANVKKFCIRGLSVAMGATLVAGAIAAVPTGAKISPAAEAIRRGVQLVTGQFNTDNLRAKYLNRNLVTENTLAKDAEHWVIVELGEDSLMDLYEESGKELSYAEFVKTPAAVNRKKVLDEKHRAFLSSLKQEGIGFECKYRYTDLVDGVALKIENGDFGAVSEMKGVSYAYYSESYAQPETVNNNANAYPTGIYNSDDVATPPYSVQGEDMVVSILDTGLDFTHQAFAKMPEKPRLSRDAVAKLLPTLDAATTTANLTVDQVYYNSKVPFAYDYADDDPDVYPSYSNHGTHVAGIIAGRDESREVGEGYTFKGVAPEAQLMICKVFTDNFDSKMLGGADGVDILAAVSDSVHMGVDVINMSLGTSAGFTIPAEKDHMDEVYQSVENAGVSLVVAASNDYSSGFGGENGSNLTSNPDSGVVGSPSTYYSALSVASIQGVKSKYLAIGQDVKNPDEAETIVINETVDGNGNTYDFIKLLYDAYEEWTEEEVDRSKPLSLPYVVIGGVGDTSNYTNSIRRKLAQQPTIALVKRGDINFSDKVRYAKANGAAGCIIYNNVSGTIRMSLGDVENPIPTCSVGMDDGKKLVDAVSGGTGYVTFAGDYLAGPFMSDFSSWGPTPDLKLKPEITAHGGEIVSSVPGGYDTQSGTSMATPNMAGAVALLRQYVKQNAKTKYKGLVTDASGNVDNVKLVKLTYQLLMSSATMALNEDGDPYSPRKQGAGLGGIKAAMDAEAYLTVKAVKSEIKEGVNTYDQVGTTAGYTAAGSVDFDKTKVEFGDDKSRTGVYDMTFTVHNLKEAALTYTPKYYVMTETIASDLKTVAEKAYMLDPEIELWVNGSPATNVTVAAGSEAVVRVRISLSDNDRDYIERSFENGMYVEGFVRLEKTGDATVDLGIPFLAFYGDWLDGPMFDYTMYEIAASDADPSIEEEDKLKPTAEATRPLGLYWNEGYVVPLGSYLYEVSEFDNEIYPEERKAALSAFDTEEARTVYELYMISTGLLRGAKYLDVTITDTTTGELVYTKREENISKSFTGGGGGVRGASVMIEVNPIDWGLSSNVTYRLDMVGTLDYAGGENAKKNTFSFEFTVDTECPVYTDYRVRYEPYRENGVTKYNIYLDVDVQDNQYVMDAMPCYLLDMPGDLDGEEGTLTLFTEYPIPAYGEKGEMTTVSLDITDYYEQILTDMESGTGYFKNGIYFAVEDYAFNQNIFLFDIREAKGFAETASLGEDGKLTLSGTADVPRPDGTTGKVNKYDLTIAQYENYNVNVVTAPSAADAGSVVIVPHNTEERIAVSKVREIFAIEGSGEQLFDVVMDTPVYNSQTQETTIGRVVLAQINVKIGGTPRSKPTPTGIELASVLNENNHIDTLQGMLVVNPGQTQRTPTYNPDGSVTWTEGPVTLKPRVTPWYCAEIENYEFTFSTDSEAAARINENGELTFERRGNATVTVAIKDAPASLNWVNATLIIHVNEEYDIESYRLYHFYGDGDDGVVDIPSDYNIMYMDAAAFQYNTKITKLVLPYTLTQIPDEAFKGCVNLEEVTIPSACTYIGVSAFAGCEKLEKVIFSNGKDPFKKDLPEEEWFTDVGSVTIGRNAFRNCTALTDLVDAEGALTKRITTVLDYAFSGCTSLKEIDLSRLRIAGRGVFGEAPRYIPTEYGWAEIEVSLASSIETVITDDNTPIGTEMFRGCTNLKHIGEKRGEEEYVLSVSRIGDYAFYGCSNLEVTFGNTAANPLYYFGDYAFAKTGFTKFTLPVGEYALGEYAFGGNENLQKVVIPEGTKITSCGSAFLGFNESNEGDEEDKKIKSVPACTLFTAFELGAGYTGVHSVEDGILFTEEDGVRLECIPVGKNSTEISIPKGAKKIGAGAFAGSPIASVTLSDVTELGAEAFENCTLLKSVTLPEGLTEIPAGAFAGCIALTDINLENVTHIGENAFKGCVALTNATLTSAEEIGAYAFSRTALAELTAPNLEAIGVAAFANAKIAGELSLPKLKTLDSYAFRNNGGITGVSLGPVTAMGISVFEGANRAEGGGVRNRDFTVTFAEGATVIGAYAFMDVYPVGVTLPSTMHGIGVGAFLESARRGVTDQYGLRVVTITGGGDDLIIGDQAFLNTIYLHDIDLSGAAYIGAQAFMREEGATNTQALSLQFKQNDAQWRTKAFRIGKKGEIGEETLTELGLPGLAIGEGAFYNAGLTRISLGDAVILGESAFMENSLTSVTLPASFGKSYVYEDEFTRIATSGKPETIESRRTNVYGGGVFAGMTTLTSINVEGDGVFFSEDGVLYSRHPNGYVLEQYPAGKSATSYTVKKGTVRIGYAAFLGTEALTEIHIPYTVRSIGGYAFMGTCSPATDTATGEAVFMGLTDYYFEGVEAPVLEAPYDEGGIFAENYTDPNAGVSYYGLWLTGMYYSNFTDYFARSLYYMLGMNLHRPENGVGYEDLSQVWMAYFAHYDEEGNLLSADLTEYAPERNTRETMDGIEALDTPEALRARIAALSSAEEKKAEIERYSAEEIAPIRAKYNAISEARQRAFLTAETVEKLYAVEKEARAIKTELGIEVKIAQLTVSSRPEKTEYYVGEKFDKTGMVVTAVYSDGSEEIVTGYTVDKTGKLSLEDGRRDENGNLDLSLTDYGKQQVPVDLTLSYGGLTATYTIVVKERPAGSGGLSAGAIAGIAVAAGVVVLGGLSAGLAVMLVKRKHKKA